MARPRTISNSIEAALLAHPEGLQAHRMVQLFDRSHDALGRTLLDMLKAGRIVRHRGQSSYKRKQVWIYRLPE